MNQTIAKTGRRNHLVAMLITVLMLLVFLGTPVLNTAAETVIEKPVNFVLLLDCSGTMWHKNDKDGLTEQSAKMFVDKLLHENTNLAIIVFGCEYGNEAFDIGTKDPGSRNRVKVAFPLQDISTDKARRDAKYIIEKETSRQEDGTMTPIGYALQTANIILEEADTDYNHAAIILLSDGQVEGQDDGYNKDVKDIAHDYYSLDDAVQTAADNKWPIYAMELNQSGENKEGDGLPGVGYHVMREKIPEKTGTEPLELRSSDQAQKLFNEIMNAFYRSNEDPEPVPVLMNEPYDFHIDELTVESTLSITGNIDKVKSIKIESPSYTKNIDVSNGSEKNGDYILVVEDGYIVLTLLVPEPGDWTATVEGEGKYVYQISMISLQESSLQLHASQEGGEIARGANVDFTASYIYNDHQFESEDLYNDHPAKLVIKGIESVEMDANASNYSCSYKFDKAGSYTVFVRVEDDMFRQGYKDSGQFTFTIENGAPEVIGSIPDQSVDVGKDLPIINVAKLFSDPEGDQLNFELKAPPVSGIKGKLTTDGEMTISTGDRGGDYDVRILATDGSKTAELPFTINVIQHPMELVGSNKINIDLIIDDPEENKKEIKWEELFVDPDGYIPDITVEEVLNKGIDKIDINDGVSFSASEKGKAEYIIKAYDANDPTITEKVTLHISAKTKIGAWWEKFKPYVFGLLGLIALIVLIRLIFFHNTYRNYGIWDINNNYDIPVSEYGVAKKASFTLDSLLDAVGEPSGFGNNIKITAGTNIDRKVYIENLNQLSVAEIDDIQIEGRDGKRVEFKRNSKVYLENDGVEVTLVRH